MEGLRKRFTPTSWGGRRGDSRAVTASTGAAAATWADRVGDRVEMNRMRRAGRVVIGGSLGNGLDIPTLAEATRAGDGRRRQLPVPGRQRAAATRHRRAVLQRPVAERGTISSVVPFLIAHAAGSEGIAPALILEPAGLGALAPPRPEEHVEVAVYLDVWRRTMALLPDADFPLRAAAAFKLEDHEVFGFLAMSCETLGQAYQRTATYRALYCVGARWELHSDASATRVIWYPWPGAISDVGYRAAMDYAM